MKNRIIEIDTISPWVRDAIRSKTRIAFSNTLFVDNERSCLWGYTREGVRYRIDLGMKEAVALYEWYVDKADHIVTDDIPFRKHICMASLVYALCGGRAAVWHTDENGNEKLDLSMLEHFV